ARAATAVEAERLDEEAGAPLLTMQRVTFDDTGRAVEFGTHTYRPSRYSFEFQLLVRS
ncbi:UTRA domain-containing protein, partial [Streptomyces griseomycini]